MNRAEYIRHLEEIRTRVRLDLDPAAEDFKVNSEKAREHLQAVVAYKPLVPQMHQVLPMLTMTLESFYDGTCNRGWAQHFIQQDLKTLEEMWPEGSE